MERIEGTPGIEKALAVNGSQYLKVHHYADEEKGPAWLARVKGEMPDREFRREILMDDGVHAGEPVWTDYVDALHGAPFFRKNFVPIINGSLYYGGWDCGMTHNPAFVLAQVAPKPFQQIHFMLEVVPDRPMPMATFAPLVRERLKTFLHGKWTDILHYGDSTGGTKSGSEGRSAFDVARDHGFLIQPCTNVWHVRETAVVWMLTDWCEQDTSRPESEWIPRAVYSGKGCPVLVEGMRGAYCNVPKKSGDPSGPGAQWSTPAKNSYSHINDAHQYVAVKVRELLNSSGIRRSRMN